MCIVQPPSQVLDPFTFSFFLHPFIHVLVICPQPKGRAVSRLLESFAADEGFQMDGSSFSDEEEDSNHEYNNKCPEGWTVAESGWYLVLLSISWCLKFHFNLNVVLFFEQFLTASWPKNSWLMDWKCWFPRKMSFYMPLKSTLWNSQTCEWTIRLSLTGWTPCQMSAHLLRFSLRGKCMSKVLVISCSCFLIMSFFPYISTTHLAIPSSEYWYCSFWFM